MYLAEQIFPDSAAHVRGLCGDRDTSFEMARQVGRRIMETDEFVGGYSLETMSAIMSQAWFAADEEECMAMTVMVMALAKSTDILPLVSVHRAKGLAARCLVSLGLFKNAMEARHVRHGAPGTDFYRQVGIAEFRNNDMPSISGHFVQWEGFMNEMFVIGWRNKEGPK